MNRENEIMEIRVDEIIPNRFQPRLNFNQTELKELSDSIKMHGIIQPLVLRRIGDKYEIIAGERRHKAAIMAGLRTVPAVIMNIDDKKSAEVAVVENLQRSDLSAIEEAQSYKKLLDMGLTQEELASKMGVAQPTIANKLRLLGLSKEVQDALLKNQISERHARSLLQIPDISLQVIMLNRIITERLTVRQTDDEISKILGKPISANQQQVTPSSIPPVMPIPGTADNLSSMFNTTQSNMINGSTPFDVDVNKIKNESEDIIKEHKPSDIDMLLRKEPTGEETTDGTPKKISLEDTPTNVDMGELIKPGMAINPFQEIETNVNSLEVPTQELQKPRVETPVSSGNSLIEEFKEQNPNSYTSKAPIPPANPAPTQKSISSAINVARTEVKKIEDLGFAVDTEEFDFEDMYQIIIKIKKD